MFLGGQLFHRLGPSRFYMGSETDPMCLNPAHVVEEFLKLPDSDWRAPIRDRMISALAGVTPPPRSGIAAVLRAGGVKVTETSRLASAWRGHKPEIVAVVVLLAYTALRAIPLAHVEQFTGSPWIFFALDAGTVPTYAIGLGLMYRSNFSTWTKAAGGALASLSFVAPYLYLWATGDDYPAYVNAIVALFLAFGIVKEIWARRRRSGVERRLARSLTNPP